MKDREFNGIFLCLKSMISNIVTPSRNPFKAIARPIFGYLSRYFNIKTLAIFWSLLHLLVMVILTINSSIPIFIIAAFLNGCTMGGSVGARMVLLIELLGEKLLVSNSISSNSGHLGYLRESIKMQFSETISSSGEYVHCSIGFSDTPAACFIC